MNDLLQKHRSGTSGPVECLGQTFASDDARRRAEAPEARKW